MNTPTSRGDLGDEIRRRRKQRNLTQKDLAKLAAVAETNVGKLERGRPVSATTLRAVARTLELPAALVAPFLGDRPAGGAPATGLSDDERAMIRTLQRRQWPATDIAEALDELRRSKPALPTVEPPSETDQQQSETSVRRLGETGTQ